jgi:sterol 3beta-glucosyltransferase
MPAALREGVGERLPADLEGWLEDGESPVFLGFGSMPVLDPEPLLEAVLSVTTALRMRAIVSENCVPDAAALPSHLRAVGAVDHDLLFPRCRAVVHHGGLGSTTASLRAGRPTMVCSVFADQPWWGEQVRRLGVGGHVPFKKLDRDSLERGLCELLEPPVEVRARAMGDAIDAEGDGLPEATELLEDWLATAGPTPLRPGRMPHASRRAKAPA